MTDSDNLNSSLNTLLASFTHTNVQNIIGAGSATAFESICIDTSNTRIGINTLDPSYSLHIIDGGDYSGNIYVSEITCISANINNLDVSHIDVSSIYFKDTISGPTLDVSHIDVSSIYFKDTISGPTLDVSSIININTISGINLLFDVSKIDISGTIDLSYSFRPKFFIPSNRDHVNKNEIYYDISGRDAGILMIKLI
jgi:hypothetical protein